MFWFLLILGVWNLCVFAVYGVDKLKAVLGSWRISEACLITLALLFGGVGGMLAMLVFRHKIRKPKFIAVYFFAVLDIIAALLVCLLAF